MASYPKALSITFVGSLGALHPTMLTPPLTSKSSVCVLATAAAFRGLREAVDEVREHLAASGAHVSVVEGVDRASAHDPAALRALECADVVLLVDGAPLHARSVWRATPLSDILQCARLIAVGSTGSVLGETMIDPRGGAPTTGLGFFGDVVLGVLAGADQTTRTRSLLGDAVVFAQLGPGSVVIYDGQWHVEAFEDLVITRGSESALLEG